MRAEAARVFVYGSLLDPRQLDAVLGRAYVGERLAARLSGFERVLTSAYAYAYLVPAADHAVEGIVLMDLRVEDLDVLDRYEDVDTDLYRRQQVEVEAWRCVAQPLRLAAFVYVAGPSLRALRRDAPGPGGPSSSAV